MGPASHLILEYSCGASPYLDSVSPTIVTGSMGHTLRSLKGIQRLSAVLPEPRGGPGTIGHHRCGLRGNQTGR